MSDIDYRIELSLPGILDIVTLPAVYETLSQYGENLRVQELHSPYLFDLARLDSAQLLDGSWNIRMVAI